MVRVLKCKLCGRHMPKIKEDSHVWFNRGYHKKCWKELKEIQDNLLALISMLSDEQQVKRMKAFKKTYGLFKLL